MSREARSWLPYELGLVPYWTYGAATDSHRMLFGHSTLGSGFGFLRLSRSSWPRCGVAGCAASDTACPSVVVRAAPVVRAAYAASAKSAALSASGDPLAAATAAYHCPTSDPAPSGRFSDDWAAFSNAAPPRMLAVGSLRNASRSTPSSRAARPRLSSEVGTA